MRLNPRNLRVTRRHKNLHTRHRCSQIKMALPVSARRAKTYRIFRCSHFVTPSSFRQKYSRLPPTSPNINLCETFARGKAGRTLSADPFNRVAESADRSKSGGRRDQEAAVNINSKTGAALD